jgi:hypothetical protein
VRAPDLPERAAGLFSSRRPVLARNNYSRRWAISRPPRLVLRHVVVLDRLLDRALLIRSVVDEADELGWRILLPDAPFLVKASRADRSGVHDQEPEVIAWCMPDERQVRLEAKWTENGWTFGKRVANA